MNFSKLFLQLVLGMYKVMDISFDLVLQKWPQICRNILKSFLDICFYNLGLKKSKMIKTISICQRKKEFMEHSSEQVTFQFVMAFMVTVIKNIVLNHKRFDLIITWLTACKIQILIHLFNCFLLLLIEFYRNFPCPNLLGAYWLHIENEAHFFLEFTVIISGNLGGLPVFYVVASFKSRRGLQVILLGRWWVKISLFYLTLCLKIKIMEGFLLCLVQNFYFI